MVGTALQRYVVLDYLAEGGMGAIYLGKKVGAGGFEMEVVLKQLLPEFTKQPEFIDLFLREARISATLDHANIVHTIDLVSVGEEFFIVMEYVKGGDLRTLLKRAKRRKRRLPPAAAILIASEVLSALAYAHAKLGSDGKPLGLIHRDVSPSNILVSGDGEVKLTDFGIAKASTHNSVFYRVRGKVGYMSPEQAKNEELDTRSDLYSTAVILYEMLTGERLFVAAGLTTSAEELYSQPIPAISRKRQDLPRELDKVMSKALALDPADRYQSARELQDALLQVAARAGLEMSIPELARRLVEACGPVAEWESAEVASSPKTEAYILAGASSGQGPGTDKIKLHDLLEDEPDDDPIAPPPSPVRRAASTPAPGSADLLEEDLEEDLEEYVVDDSNADDAWAADAQKRPAQIPVVERQRRAHTASLRLANMEITSMIQAPDFSEVGKNPIEETPGPRFAFSPGERAGLTRRAELPERRPRGERERGSRSRVPVVLFVLVLVLGAAGIAIGISVTGSTLEPERAARPPTRPPTAAPAVKTAAVSSLEIESVPSGAQVEVDGREVCKTPCNTEDVPTATAMVRVVRDGYLPWTSLVNFAQVAHSKRTAKLRRKPKDRGEILIKTDAPCELLVDGEKIGHVSSAGPLVLPVGRTEITVVADSGATSSVTVEIEEGRTIERTISMP